MPGMNTTALADTIKTQYETRLLTRALPRMVHAKWATQGRLTKAGSYEIRKFSSMPLITSALYEGTTPSEQDAPSISKITMTPAWYGSWISYNDKLEMEAFDPIISETSAILGEQCGISLDTLCRNTMTSGATKRYSGTSPDRAGLDTTADKISYADFVGAVAALKLQNALPAEGELFPVIMHPMTWAQLMQDDIFVALFTRSTPEVMKTGNMGQILDCSIYVSSNARTYIDGGTSGADVYSMLFVGKESYATAGVTGLEANLVNDSGENNTGKSVSPVSIIVKDLGETGLDPLNQRGTIGWKASYTDAILNSSWIVDLENVTQYS